MRLPVFRAALCGVCSLIALSCASAKRAVADSIGDQLSGYTRALKPLKRNPPAGQNAMLALTGETDTRLAADFFPTALKLYDILHFQNPSHGGLAVMTGSLHIMYASAFVQAPAERLPDSEFDAKDAELRRAKAHYVIGRDCILAALERKYPGFAGDITSGEPERIAAAAGRLMAEDVNAAYWLGAGWLAVLSVDLDFSLLGVIGGAEAALTRAAELEPLYSRGAIWDVLCAYYAATADFGGDIAKADECFAESVAASEGKLPGPYVTYAEAVCKKYNDRAGFTAMLEQALAIAPEDMPEDSRLAGALAQNKARWLLANAEQFFIEW